MGVNEEEESAKEEPMTMAKLFGIDSNDPRLDPVVHQVFDLNAPIEAVEDKYFKYGMRLMIDAIRNDRSHGVITTAKNVEKYFPVNVPINADVTCVRCGDTGPYAYSGMCAHCFDFEFDKAHRIHDAGHERAIAHRSEVTSAEASGIGGASPTLDESLHEAVLRRR